MVIAIKIDTRNVMNMLKGYQKTLPKAADRGIQNLTKFAAKTLADQARGQRIRSWKGEFYGTLKQQQSRPIKLGKYSYGVSIPEYAMALDKMQSHWVALKRGRAIRQWALDRGIAVTVGTGFRPEVTIYPFRTTSIFVHRHPFIDKATKIVNQKTKKIVEKEINKSIRRKGKR